MTLVGPALFAVIVWVNVVLLVAVFGYLLYGVVRAGGVDLAD